MRIWIFQHISKNERHFIQLSVDFSYNLKHQLFLVIICLKLIVSVLSNESAICKGCNATMNYWGDNKIPVTFMHLWRHSEYDMIGIIISHRRVWFLFHHCFFLLFLGTNSVDEQGNTVSSNNTVHTDTHPPLGVILFAYPTRPLYFLYCSLSVQAVNAYDAGKLP